MLSAHADTALLTRTPMLLAHDAASGYLGGGGGVIRWWTQTQSVGLADQLTCGARAFDARPMLSRSGKLVWHHGPIEINYSFARSLVDLMQWLRSHPTELVLLSIWDCVGDGCMEAVGKQLSVHNISTVVDCSELRSLTYSGARARAELPGGGSLLAITAAQWAPDGAACSVGNYDPTMACTGRIDGDDDDSSYYGCWLSDATRAYPVGRMLEQLDNVTRRGLSDGHFTQAQGLWQESEASIAIGALRNSSLLLDQRRSGLNEILAREVASGRWRGAVNFLEVNDVCDHGAELAKALTPDLEPQPG